MNNMNNMMALSVIELNAINDMGHFVLRNCENQMITNSDLYQQIMSDLVISTDLGCRSYRTKFNESNKVYVCNGEIYEVDFSGLF